MEMFNTSDRTIFGEDIPEEILICLRENFLGKQIGNEKGLVTRINNIGIQIVKEEEIDGKKQIRVGYFRTLPLTSSNTYKEGEEGDEGYDVLLKKIEEVRKK